MAAFIFSGIPLLALLLHLLWPALALAQESKAGVVTTIHGAASVARVAVPQEIPLKLKDDVLYRDRITTKEQSIVRVLLGGKALVTVRELSELTISEEPGRATVEVHSGKIALAVARKLLRPGEYIEIRTPNAVAAVRGTVVIIEVLQAALGALATTLVNVLNGSVAVSLPQAPTVPPVTVSAGQSLPVTSTGFGQVGSVSPTATQGLTPPSSAPTSSPASGQIATNQQAQATLLALAFAPPPPTIQTTTSSPPPPATSDIGVQESTASEAVQQQTTAPAGSLFLASDVTLQMDKSTSLATFSAGTAQNPQAGAIVCATPPCPPVLLTSPVVTGSAPGGSMISLSGPNGGPVIELRNSTVTATTSPVSPLFRVNGVDLTTTTPLVLDPSTVTVGGPLYDSVSANVTITGAGGLQPVTRLLGGSTLKNTVGPVFRIVGGSLMADALGISDSSGNTFDLTGTLLDLTNTKVTLRTLGEEVLDNNKDTAKFTLALNEPAIRMVNSTLKLTKVGDSLWEVGDIKPPFPTEQGVVLIADPSTLNLKGSLAILEGVTSNATDPLVQLTGTTVNQTETTNPLILGSVPTGVTSTMAGPALKAKDSTINTSGSVFSFTSNGSLQSNTSQPFATFDPGSVTSARNFARLTGGFSLTLKGSFADATDTTFETTSSEQGFFPIHDGASLTTTGTADPLLKFTGTAAGKSKVTAARGFLSLSINTPGAPMPSETLSGPLLNATLTTFKNGDPTSNTFTFLFVGDSAELKSTSNVALMSFDNSSVDTAGNILTLRRSTPAGAPSKVTLLGNGGLFSATNGSTFDTSSLGFGPSFGVPSSACCSGFSISQGAQLSSATSSSLITLVSSTFKAGPDAQSGGNFFSVTDSPNPDGIVAPAKVSVAGRLLQVTNSLITALFHLVNVQRSTIESTTLDSLVKLDGFKLNGGVEKTVALGGFDPIANAQTTGSSLFFLNGSATENVQVLTPAEDPDGKGVTLTLGKDKPIQHGGVFLEASNARIEVQNGVRVDPALLEASAPLLKLTGTLLTSASHLVDLGPQARLTGNIPGGVGNALVSLQASTLTVKNGSLFNVAGGSFLNVTQGNLFLLDNTSTLNITGGGVVTVSGGSVFKLTMGSLGVFGPTGTNMLNVTNTAALCGGCSLTTSIPNFGGYPVLLKNGAPAGNVVVNAGFVPFSGLSTTNKVNVSGASGAVLVVDGASSKVRLGF